MDFEENVPQQEAIIHDVYGRPGKEYLQESPELHAKVDSKNLLQKFLLKQPDLDKILMAIQRNVLKGTNLPVTVMEIQVGYLNSPYFEDAIF